ncbi:MAG: hypothetical protein QNK15_07605 [Cycloclasticus sp.]|nr:hypothetical protein [Cycloclasticus sp.]
MPQTVNPVRHITVKSGVTKGNRVEYKLNFNHRIYKPYFASDHVTLNGSVESAVAIAALGGMQQGLDLHIADVVSPTFIHNQRRLVEIFTNWFPIYKKINIIASDSAQVSKPSTGRVGSFFTGGVDSFYTFIKNKPEITDLIYVHGYDVKLTDLARRAAITAMGQAIETSTGVRFIEIETNCIRIFRDYGRWGLHGHGYGLGAVARQLSDYLDRLYIPSSFDYGNLSPWGSHPDTDPLFSDESLEIIHDGCEASRSQKIEALGDNALALDHLRVCWERVEGAYNCGCCEKCIRTMTSLYAFGKLEKANTFPSTLDPAAIHKLVIYDDSLVTFAKDNIDVLQSTGLGNTSVCNAWEHIVERPEYANKIILLLQRIRKKIRRSLSKKLPVIYR